MSRNAAIVGAAALPCGRHQRPPDDPVQVLEHELLASVVLDAVGDAGLSKEAVDALFFTHPRPYTRQLYFGTFLASYLNIPCDGVLVEVVADGMTGGLAFDQAAEAVRSGRAEVALALGINLETAVASSAHMDRSMRATGDVEFHAPFGFIPISWYAMDAMRYLHELGAKREDLAMVAVKNRRHGALNPLAHYQKEVTLEEVLAQRMIVEPLGLFEVPPRSDGAACLVVASEEVARSLGRPYVLLKGRGFHHEGVHQISDVPGDMIWFGSVERAAKRAFEEARISAADVDLAELYAPCTIVEVLVGEALGFTKRGQGARAAAAGETSLGGRIPLCTSGGLMARGHPPFVTGLYSFVEIAEQLRNRAGKRQVSGARLGLTSCELGNHNAALIHVFEGRS